MKVTRGRLHARQAAKPVASGGRDWGTLVVWTVALGALALLPACAPKAPPVVPGPDRYPEFVYPSIPESLGKTARNFVQPHDLAWRALQAGDTRAAERGFTGVLRKRADFFPSSVGLAYVDLARGSTARALEGFERVVTRAPGYLPALMGRAQALLRAERPDDALAAFEVVLGIDPSLVDVRRRVETLRFRRLDEALADARRAEEAGDWTTAKAAYEKAAAASPESAFLQRNLARVEQQLGQRDEALLHARRAVELDPTDGAAYLLVAALHEAGGQWEEAITALAHARDLDAAPDLGARIEALRAKAALAKLPAEFRAIPQAERVTRGDLAALLGARLDPLLSEMGRGQTVLITDARNHWARAWIMTVARAKVMEAFDNHTFQPRSPIRRGDLAQAASRVLDVVAQRDPSMARAWTDKRRDFADLGPSNLYYQAAALAVAAGVLDPGEGGRFQAGRTVTGAEAVEAVDRLEALVARWIRSVR